MNNLIKTSLIAALVCGSSNVAAIELGAGTSLSFNAALVSNYLFRGVSLSDDKVAGQVGADLEHESGLYAGIWGSSYDNGGDTEYEIDWWAGYSFAVNDNISVGTSVTRYYYADVGGHTTEYAIFSDVYGLGLAAHYDQHLESYYFEGNYDLDVAENMVVSTHAGYAEPDAGDGAYDLGVTLGYSLNDNVELFAGAVYQEDSKDAYVVGVGVSF
ncbi:TorF family putative porin [Ferrimonas senticii]|uniref:TorF family putative porin n=1 Tax=Ferrimonas senticii TaxID=394566 RepID=UPI00041658E4|nr:TorF family putative porin [Ferrimonas senticii]